MSVELTYFDMSGLGEPVRVMLSFGGIDFVDKRLGKEEWSKIKSETKFGQLPRLLIDGVELFQSRAICRYIATKVNLRGDDAKEAALTDMWVDTFDDMRSSIVRHYYVPDSEQRTQKLEQIKNIDLPKILSTFEQALEAGQGNFFVGNKITWADVMFFAYMQYISELLCSTGDELTSHFPRLHHTYKAVKNSQGIQGWLKKRPVSPSDMRIYFL